MAGEKRKKYGTEETEREKNQISIILPLGRSGSQCDCELCLCILEKCIFGLENQGMYTKCVCASVFCLVNTQLQQTCTEFQFSRMSRELKM